MTLTQTKIVEKPEIDADYNGNIMITNMLANSIIGFVSHIVFYPILNNYFMIRTSRLLSYAIGLTTDIILSWFTLRSYSLSHSDRRRGPAIPFDKYIFVRGISALTFGAGVVLGYMLDKKD